MRCAGGAILQTSSATPVNPHLAPYQPLRSTSSLRIMDSRNIAPSSEPVSVPADHEDPNHPHFPGDLEHRSGGRHSIITTKRILIAAAVVTTILIIIAAAIWGVVLAQKHDEKAAAMAVATVTPDITTSAPLEIHTVSLNATTTVYSTTRVPLLVAPSLATSTIILAPSRTPAAPLRPVAAETIIATSTPSTPAPSDAPVGDISITGCFFNGAWVLKAQCEKNCPTWDGHETRCEGSKRSRWVCVSCPSKS